jgi:hypothetical protein
MSSFIQLILLSLTVNRKWFDRDTYEFAALFNFLSVVTRIPRIQNFSWLKFRIFSIVLCQKETRTVRRVLCLIFGWTRKGKNLFLNGPITVGSLLTHSI